MTTPTTPILGLDELEASQSQPHVPINAAIRALEVLAQLVVASQTLTAPPGSPAEGDRYIVGGGATGDWAGHDEEVAYYSGGWQFLVPERGWICWVEADGDHYTYGAGSIGWVPLGTSI